MSSNGSVVVGESGLQVFRWTEDDDMVGLGLLDGADDMLFPIVSGDGATVLGSWATLEVLNGIGVSVIQGVFVWTEASGLRDLRTLLVEEHGLPLDGWTLSFATAVSEDGGTIVGTGSNPDGEIESWIAVLPEPHGTILLAVAMVLLSRRHRHTSPRRPPTRTGACSGGSQPRPFPSSRRSGRAPDVVPVVPDAWTVAQRSRGTPDRA